METVKLRNMLHLQWAKAKMMKNRFFLFCLLLLSSLSSFAQREIFREEQDDKPYYFGLSLSAVYSRFHIEHNPSFLQQDSILAAEPLNAPGISLRLVAGLNLTERFEVRFNPGLIFTDRPILYQLKYRDPDYGYEAKKSVESIITTFPLNIKFKSDRIGNFRVYMLGGGKVDLDLASNAQKRKADDQVKIKRLSYGIEAGMGFNFYRKSVTITPEIKISNGLNDLHDRNDRLNYSRVIDGIRSRMIIFSIHLEG
jgi:hypothetical protein